LETGLEALDIAKIQRKEVKEQSAVAFGRKRDHVGALVLGHLLVDDLQIRRLSA
jgi:hypothetical protein